MEKPPFFSPSPRLQVQRAVQHLRVQRLHRATLVRHVPHDLIHPPGSATQRRVQRQVGVRTTVHVQRSRPLRPHASTRVPHLPQRPPVHGAPRLTPPQPTHRYAYTPPANTPRPPHAPAPPPHRTPPRARPHLTPPPPPSPPAAPPPHPPPPPWPPAPRPIPPP